MKLYRSVSCLGLLRGDDLLLCLPDREHRDRHHRPVRNVSQAMRQLRRRPLVIRSQARAIGRDQPRLRSRRAPPAREDDGGARGGAARLGGHGQDPDRSASHPERRGDPALQARARTGSARAGARRRQAAARARADERPGTCPRSMRPFCGGAGAVEPEAAAGDLSERAFAGGSGLTRMRPGAPTPR